MVRTASDTNFHAAGGSEQDPGQSSVAGVSYRRLLWLRFRQNRLAIVGLGVLIVISAVTLVAKFVAPYDAHARFLGSISVPPQFPKFIDLEGRLHLRPFIYETRMERDPNTLDRVYIVDRQTEHPLRFFVHGAEYRIGFLRSDIHLFGTDGVGFFLLGTDIQGRDVFSRVVVGGQISTTVGLIGVALSLTLGISIGIASGLIGGLFDQVVQRGVEIILSFPKVPLWLVLSAVLPRDWSPILIFFAITIILSFIGWGSMARVVRGMTLNLKNEEYVMSARMSGGGTWWILLRHLLPANLSYVIVSATLAVPGMILGETALSFLGLGLRPPIVSWGVLLQDTQKVMTIARSPWLITPVFLLVLTVLAFNFVGDGLRDAVDPLSRY